MKPLIKSRRSTTVVRPGNSSDDDDEATGTRAEPLASTKCTSPEATAVGVNPRVAVGGRIRRTEANLEHNHEPNPWPAAMATAVDKWRNRGQGIEMSGQWRGGRGRVETRATNGFGGRLKLLLINFFRATSVHGFAFTVQQGVHVTERILWLFCIGAAFWGAISLNQRVWQRYYSSPTVIAIDRNKFSWNTTFPSVTLCPRNRIDSRKLQLYLDANRETFPREEDRRAFHEFVLRLSNATFESFHEVPQLQDGMAVPPRDYMELVHNLTAPFNPDITSGTSRKLHMTETITELGICYAVNSRVAVFNSFGAWRTNQWQVDGDSGDGEEDDKDKFKEIEPMVALVHPFDGEIFANIINISTSYEVFFHGAHEVPDITRHRQRYAFSGSDYTTVDLQVLETVTSAEARALRISQRKCRFADEAQGLTSSGVYSFTICRMECRLRMALRLCDCIPYFYRPTGKDGQTFRVCDYHGMQCLYRKRRDLLALQRQTTTGEAATGEPPCECDRNCNDSEYSVHSLRSRDWFLGANLQFGISTYPKQQLRRNVLFRFEDLLAYTGSTAGLFLGCSLLSFTEFIYFFTWRFVKLVFWESG